MGWKRNRILHCLKKMSGSTRVAESRFSFGGFLYSLDDVTVVNDDSGDNSGHFVETWLLFDI